VEDLEEVFANYKRQLIDTDNMSRDQAARALRTKLLKVKEKIEGYPELCKMRNIHDRWPALTEEEILAALEEAGGHGGLASDLLRTAAATEQRCHNDQLDSASNLTLTKKQAGVLREIFRLYDLHDQGFVSEDEYARLNSENMQHINFDIVDTNQQGRITIEELLALGKDLKADLVLDALAFKGTSSPLLKKLRDFPAETYREEVERYHEGMFEQALVLWMESLREIRLKENTEKVAYISSSLQQKGSTMYLKEQLLQSIGIKYVGGQSPEWFNEEQRIRWFSAYPDSHRLSSLLKKYPKPT